MQRIRTLAILVVASMSLVATTALAHDPGHDDPGGHGGGGQDQHGEQVKAKSGTKMSIKVVKDRFSGWNLLINTRRFRFAPEHASQKHRAGEGHAHLAIDGKPITRIYGAGYYIPDLKPGRHKIRVALATNNHAEYVNAKGEPFADTAIVRVPKPSN